MEEDSVFPNPFDCTAEEFVSNQLEMIKLQYNGMLKDNYQGKNLIEFYKFLPRTEYVQLRSYAHKLQY